ncbi:MAG: lipid IV(A) 3-deoxy-D-manno-octulosonic acid transferase [Methylobacillus sp.]|jgi:3-deoxy-D-manno-octulosonic-acid transferase|nr:lipid IV(A) 3-deoxy-D-manno-octulosonic acid transferase [Methylobacillus sp.]
MPRWIYTLLLLLLVPFALLKLVWRALRQPEYLRHIPERFGFYRAPRPDAPLIWLHAVSVGETRAAAPLVALLRERYPRHRILITHTTPTGRAAGEQLYGDTILRCYLPYDLPGAMRRFLDHFRPQIGLLMETELWFNLVAACERRDLPLLLVNARLSERSARGYARLGALARDGFRRLRRVAAQTEDDAARLRALGAQNVNVTGNLKFDVAPPPDAHEQGIALRRLFGVERPVFLAASTRDGEESLVLDAVATAQIPHLLTVIVPRHPQRFNEVAALLEKRRWTYARRSTLREPIAPEMQFILGDSMGEMFAYYAACDLAFIGGSLLPLGGQNLIEACAMGKPTLIGEHTWNFKAVADNAVATGAARRVADANALGAQIRELFQNAETRERMARQAAAFSNQHSGATRRVLTMIEDVLAG